MVCYYIVMKKHCDFFLIFIGVLVTFNILVVQGFAQSNYIDSLRQVISGQPDKSEKADNFLKLATEFIKIDKDSTLLYYERTYALASFVENGKAMADADILKGKLLRNTGQNQEALFYFERSLHLADSLHDSARMARASYNAGFILIELSEYDKALENFSKSLALYLNLNDTFGIGANYNLIGLTHSRRSAYDSAAIYYDKAVIIYEKTGNEANLGVIYNNLGDVFLQLDQLENARKYVLKSKEINTKFESPARIALDFNLLGRIDSEANDFQNALVNYQQAEKIYSQMNDSLHLCDVQNNIGVLYKKQKNFNASGKYFDLALNGYRKLKYIRGIIVVLGNQAALLTDFGKYREAISLHDTVLNLATQYGYKDYRKDAFMNLSNNYFNAGNYQKAFEFQTLFYNLKDSIFTIEKEKVVNDLLFKYEKEKDQAHILALEKDNLEKDLVLRQRTSQRNAYLFSGIGLLALALFVFLYFRQKTVKDRIIARQKIQQLEEEKKLMGAKLLVEGQEDERKRIATELHDGLGVLLSATKMQFSTIIDRSPENKEVIEKAYRLLEQATGDVRKISHNMMPGLLTKLGFYEAVEDLFENIGDSQGLIATCTITGNQDRLAENKEIMLYRIVQEMTNNSLKHAEARNISLRIHVLQGMLELNYSDDGKGFDYRQKLESESMGLKSIQSRVNFLNGELAVESKPGEGVKYAVHITV